MSILSEIPYREPIIDQNNMMTRSWAEFFRQLYTRVGGGAGFSKTFGNSGYQIFSGGLYLQWGVTASVASGATQSVSLPTNFPTAIMQVLAGLKDNSGVSTAATGQWGSGNYSTSGFDLYNRTSVSVTFNWIALGY